MQRQSSRTRVPDTVRVLNTYLHSFVDLAARSLAGQPEKAGTAHACEGTPWALRNLIVDNLTASTALG